MLVSHNLGLIASLCDSVAVMYAGEVVESGSVEQIFHAPRHPYTRALLDCDPARSRTRTGQLPTIPGEVPDLQSVPAGCAFAPRCPHAGERCRTSAPELKSLDDGQKGRCHFAGTLSDPAPAPAPAPAAGPGPGAADAVARPGPAVSNGPLLEIRNLRVRFRISGRLRAFLERNRDPFVDAVLGANLSLRRGGTVGLIGESGSGKTTLGRSVLGLLEPSEGSIVVDGRDVGELSAGEWTAFRRHLAMIFQDPVGSLSPRKTVRSLLAEPFRIHGGGRRQRGVRHSTALRDGAASGPHAGPVSPRALRRAGPAGRGCPCARPRAFAGGCGRADRRPRRIRAGRDPESPRGAARGAGVELPAGQPQPARDPAHLRPPRDHVPSAASSSGAPARPCSRRPRIPIPTP